MSVSTEEWESNQDVLRFTAIPSNIQCCRNCAINEDCVGACLAPDQGCFLLRPDNPHPKCPICIAADCIGFDYTSSSPNFRFVDDSKAVIIPRKTKGVTCWGCRIRFPEAESLHLVFWCSVKCLINWLNKKGCKVNIKEELI